MSANAGRETQATLSDRLARPLQRFLAVEAASTILLLLATLLALAWANSPWRESYAALWHTSLGVRLGGFELALPRALGERRAHGALLLPGRDGDQARARAR